MPKAVGLYMWSGPDTIRLLRTKYHSPLIDEASFMDACSLDALSSMKAQFNLTDLWLTYSWGFKDEENQQTYIRTVLKDAKAVNLRTHLYIQGWNLVKDDFEEESFWMIDRYGNTQPYSKGRLFACPNNPDFARHFLDKIAHACAENCTGIFVDNILFGRPPIQQNDNLWTGGGCYCVHCEKKYAEKYQTVIPRFFSDAKTIDQYNTFRSESSFALLSAAQKISHKHNKTFSVNFYDPISHDAKYMYGYDREKIAQLVDCILIENFGLAYPESTAPIKETFAKYQKPVFVVNYKNGIGYDSQLTQEQLDTVYSLADSQYNLCIKGTEYITAGKWHTLHYVQLRTPKIIPLSLGHFTKKRPLHASFLHKVFLNLLQRFLSFFLPIYFESAFLYRLSVYLQLESKVIKKSFA